MEKWDITPQLHFIHLSFYPLRLESTLNNFIFFWNRRNSLPPRAATPNRPFRTRLKARLTIITWFPLYYSFGEKKIYIKKKKGLIPMQHKYKITKVLRNAVAVGVDFGGFESLLSQLCRSVIWFFLRFLETGSSLRQAWWWSSSMDASHLPLLIYG